MRLSRTYRGRDIHWWMDAIGQLDERWDETEELARARRLPSLQLVGSPERRDIDLNALAARRTPGRAPGRGLGQQGPSSPAPWPTCAPSPTSSSGRLLDTIDAFAGGTGERGKPTRLPAPVLDLDLRSGEFAVVGVRATGIAPDFSCLDAPTFDRGEQDVHDGGATRVPGLYVLGLPVFRRRRSRLIDGAAADAADISAHLASHLDSVESNPPLNQRQRAAS